MRYAVVAVDLNLRQKMGLLTRRHDDGRWVEEHPLFKTYHYAVPAELSTALDVGHLVWVPFGRDHRQGLVVAFDDAAPVPPEQIRPILKLASSRPLLHPYQIDLARWISHYYLAPLWDTLVLMLPSGLLQGTERVVRLTTRGSATGAGHPLKRDERTLMAWLAAQPEGESTVRELGELLGSARRARAAVAELEQLGLVEEALVEKPPAVRPRRERFVALVADPTRLQQRFPRLGRRSRQAELLAWLATQPGARASRVAALEAAQAKSEAPLRALVERGWVVVAGRADGEDEVRLAVPPEWVPGLLTELRGTQTHLAVLEFLARNPTEMTVGEVYAATGAGLRHLEALAAEGLILITERKVTRNPLAGRVFAPDEPPVLTDEQAQAWREIEAALRADRRERGEVFLIHGVTGSGKTELYLRAVAEVLRRSRQAIVLVPEIALTPQTVARFGARFGEAIALQHSQLSPGERFDEWRRLRDGRAEVAIGSRSAIFAPVAAPGLVVIDEEHEWTYKQEALPGYRFPHYHARDVAEALARLTGCTVLLGSATPSVESFYRARTGAYRLLTMTGRVALHRRQRTPTLGPLLQQRGVVAAGEPPDQLAGGLPPVQVVDLRQELRAGNTSIFSRALQRAVETTLAAGQQVVLFLNRRGASTFVMCRDCGWVASCPRCDLPLTYHEGLTSLICHQCNRHASIPTVCPRCLSVRVKHFGVGTEQVEARARTLFPGARIMRWDKDTAGEKGAHERLLARFAAGQADLLIGTQMIAKGLDLPLVTLVGVITADTALHLPDFRAAERTFQLLTQVAGRAGRSFLGGRVILQTYTPLHYAIQAAARHDYHDFYRHEMAFRTEHAYPPVAPLIKLVYSAPQAEATRAEAEEMAVRLSTRLTQLGLGATEVIGPAPAFFGRLRGRYRWQLLVRGAGAHELLLGVTLPPGWIIDVDPGSVL